MHIPGIKYIYMQSFMFVGVSVIEILKFNWKRSRRIWQHCENWNYKYYTCFIDFFQILLEFFIHVPAIKYVYMLNFMFVDVSVIEILEFNRKKKRKNMAKL